MKKTLVSLATASLIASSAMAADKGIDFTTSGQAVFYYQTLANNGTGADDLFDKTTARANVGVQLNFDADLKNDFTFGSQITYLGDVGMDKNIADNQMLTVGGNTNNGNIADELALTKFWVAKKIANTTVKLGRQELPKSLSPFAFTEGWTVVKNTFDAAVVINKDLPKTTLAGVYIDKSNRTNPGADISSFNDTVAGAGAGTVYMATAQTKAIPMATLTASYYDIAKIGGVGGFGAQVMWGDLLVAGKKLPMGLKIGLQGGNLNVDRTGADDTTAWGAKVAVKPIKPLFLQVAYSSVNDGSLEARNIGTNVKTPLYTQMVLNQGNIDLDADTWTAKAVYNTGKYGKIIAAYGMTDDKSTTNRDYKEFDLIYKVKAGNVNYLAMWVNQDWDKKVSTVDNANLLRFVARYNF